MWDAQMKFRALGFSLAHPQPLQGIGEWPDRKNISMSRSLFSDKNKQVRLGQLYTNTLYTINFIHVKIREFDSCLQPYKNTSQSRYRTPLASWSVSTCPFSISRTMQYVFCGHLLWLSIMRVCAILCLFFLMHTVLFPLLTDPWVVSGLQWLWVRLWRTFVFRSCVDVFSICLR